MHKSCIAFHCLQMVTRSITISFSDALDCCKSTPTKRQTYTHRKNEMIGWTMVCHLSQNLKHGSFKLKQLTLELKLQCTFFFLYKKSLFLSSSTSDNIYITVIRHRINTNTPSTQRKRKKKKRKERRRKTIAWNNRYIIKRPAKKKRDHNSIWFIQNIRKKKVI